MSKMRYLLALLVLLAGAAPVLADGKFYAYEEIPPEIPYQRALLLFAGGQEMLFLQSKYQVAGSPAGSMGWVVPVPSVPDLDSLDADVARGIFDELDRIAAPRVVRVGPLLRSGLVLFLLAGLPVLLLVGVLSLLVRRIQPKKWQWRLLLVWAILACLTCIFQAVFMLAGETREAIGGVEVIKSEQVGIYDVQVIRSDDATALLAWLDQHQFRFDEVDVEVFDEYLSRDWVFVVAVVDPATVQAERGAIAEGLVAPLILRFQTEAPVYPLALTATAGHPTQILLYLLGEGKWENDGRLDLHFAGQASISLFRLLTRELDSQGSLAGEERNLPVLCKFKGTLAPEEMREDLIFKLAEDDRPYRKRVVRW